MMMHSKLPRPIVLSTLCKSLAVAGVALWGGSALAQNYPVTPQQKQIARATAAAGVPVSELAPNAPSEYIVKRGDTLWGMNLEQIRNPHLIYPGQILWLEIADGRARLRLGRRISGGGSGRLEPRVRVESLDDKPIPTIAPNLIEPFLSEPLVVDEATLKNAHWIVSSKDDRSLLGTGDRVYARSQSGHTLQDQGSDDANLYRIFKNPVPIKDPATQEVLGYEGRFVGRARLVRAETVSTTLDGGKAGVPEAASLDIVYAKEDVRTGDRLLPEPPRELLNHTPHAPTVEVNGLVASVYGDAVTYVGQNQMVTINKGTRDGIVRGDVLALISTGRRVSDKTTGKWRGEMVKLPDERNGLLYIFRPFEKVSYGLVIEIKDPVKVGDRVENPIQFNDMPVALPSTGAAQ